MNKLEEVLTIAQEECAEVIQAISKCRRFGLDNVHKSGKSQRENLTEEVGDLYCMLELLVEHAGLDSIQVLNACVAKKSKLETWSNIFNG
jgi:NTP pyrophosphatase (non-canonical NTP hydrolase)